ncbi:MAG: CDP-diacylglycerol--glycerol-3-phosphate 3-phosphatidyltransferase [Candidatus Bipolaricaulia bacterium]
MAWNLPNTITILRIATIPLLLFVLLSGVIPGGEIVALVIFALASLSDAVDGWLARNRSQETVFGKLADPIADKLLIMAALAVFVGRSDFWNELLIVSFVIILAREFLVMGLRMLAIDKNIVISASWSGKLKTLSHIGLVLVLLIDSLGGWGTISGMIVPGAIYLAVTMALISGVEYFFKSRELFRTAA